jgi:hypothetical protein
VVERVAEHGSVLVGQSAARPAVGRRNPRNGSTPKTLAGDGHFPNDDAVAKLLWLAIRDIEDKRARQRAAERGVARADRRAPGRLVEGAVVQGWKQALGALALAYPDRLAGHLLDLIITPLTPRHCSAERRRSRRP